MIIAQALFYRGYIKGTITFTQISHKSPIRVDIKLNGVEPGYHGIHVHEKSVKQLCKKKSIDCCLEAGSHFNGGNKIWKPTYKQGTPHGSWRYNNNRHIGDLCNNIYANHLGEVSFTYYDNLISLDINHPHCIIGRSIIIHENKDDEGFDYSIDRIIESKITGNAGSRIACSNIYLV